MPTWDDRIDETARRLTDGQPRRGFTTRVVARLDDRPRRWSRAWLIAPAAAAAVVVVVAVIMPRERPGDAARNLRVETVRTDVRLKPDATSPEFGPSPEPARAAVTAGTTRSGQKPTDTSIDVDHVVLTELAPAPIEVAPLAVGAPVVDALPDLVPLAIEEISIDAIDFAQ